MFSERPSILKIFQRLAIFLYPHLFKFTFVVLPSIIARQIDEVERIIAGNAIMVNSFIYGSHKRTLLHKAAEIGDLGICQVLIKYEAEVNKQDARKQTPLWFAAKEGHGDICNVLIQNGAFVDAKDNAEETPLWIAAIKGHENVCKMLIENGASINAVLQFQYGTPNRILVDEDMWKRFMKWNSEYGNMFKLFTLFLN